MIFQRSLVREFSLIAIAVVGILLAIILTRLLILLLGKAAAGDVLPEAVIGLIAFGILTYLPVLLGIAVFVAVLLALTRSYRDSEMTVWFTSGLSIAAWVKPVLQFALPVALICALLSLVIAPWSQAQSVEYQRLLASRDEVSNVTPGVFVESRASDRVFFVDKLTERDDVVNNIFVQSTQNNRMGVMVAQRGFIETAENGDRFVVLLNGRRYEGTPGTLDYRTVDFDRYALRIEPREAARQAPSNKAIDSLDLLAGGKPEQIAELHWRLALPLAVLIMGLFAIPLAFVNPRSGRSWNLVFAVLIYALYNNLLSVFQAYTAQGKIPAWLGLWPVHLTMIAIVAFLFYRQLYGLRWQSALRR
ncbi:MAG TPA: LPS export ABC transporter permease LptF [Usitatibacter sp.]|jgi:lipopolysaccharide export system permease protein|nr:LPS export ABC transporter permease LptF [Usitatibacter sp.]